MHEGRSVQRLQLHNRSAMIVAHPECDWRSGIVDEYPAKIRKTRQQIFDKFAGLRIQALHRVGELSARPYFAAFVGGDIVWPRARRGSPPFFELFRLRIEHPDAIRPVLAEPQPPFPVDHAPAWR